MPKKFVAEDERSPGCTHVLLMTTGSVASVKAPFIVAELLAVSGVLYTTAITTYYDDVLLSSRI